MTSVFKFCKDRFRLLATVLIMMSYVLSVLTFFLQCFHIESMCCFAPCLSWIYWHGCVASVPDIFFAVSYLVCDTETVLQPWHKIKLSSLSGFIRENLFAMYILATGLWFFFLWKSFFFFSSPFYIKVKPALCAIFSVQHYYRFFWTNWRIHCWVCPVLRHCSWKLCVSTCSLPGMVLWHKTLIFTWL